LKELHWQALKERPKHKKLLFMHKIRNNELPISTTDMFDIKTNSRYNLHSNNRDFTLDKPNRNFMKKGVSYAASAVWNNLPLEAKGLAFLARNSSLFLISILQNDIL
jgi:hypothetical protein